MEREGRAASRDSGGFGTIVFWKRILESSVLWLDTDTGYSILDSGYLMLDAGSKCLKRDLRFAGQ